MKKEEINEILKNHQMWLDGRDCGVYADISDEDLCGANLIGANLYDATLYGANLCEANLYNANLRGADLRYANLRCANICGTDFCGANLLGVKNIPFIPMVCPDFGPFIGFKKASKYIIQLKIPSDAKRSSATTRKCRCDKAKVVAIQNLDGTNANVNAVRSNRDPRFIYEIGKTVSVKNFDDDRWNECSTGIHFFINRQEAVEYEF